MEETQDAQTPAKEGEQQAQPLPDVEKLTQEIEHKEAEIKRLQGVLRAKEKSGISKEELSTLHTKIDDLQDWTANALDDLIKKVSGEEDEKPSRKSYRQQLDERRKTRPEPQPEIDPSVRKFMGYVDSQGLSIDDPLVKEAIGDEVSPRSPNEALSYLKGKIEGKTKAEIQKEIQDGIQKGLEQKLKDLGLTTSGAGSPSAAGGKTFTTKQIRDMTPEEFIKNKDAIAEAQRQGRIKV